MLRAEDGQGDGETQIAQGYDFVQTAGPGDIGLGGPQRNEEKQDAGAAHRNRRARDLKKCDENGCEHVDARRKLARPVCALSVLHLGRNLLLVQKRSEVYTHPKGVFRKYGPATRLAAYHYLSYAM